MLRIPAQVNRERNRGAFEVSARDSGFHLISLKTDLSLMFSFAGMHIHQVLRTVKL